MKQKKSTQEGKKEKRTTTSSKKYKVIPTQNFIDEAVEISKKYPGIKADYLRLGKQLQLVPDSGDNLGSGMYKVRMPITEAGIGKRGGIRVIVYVVVIDRIVYVLSTYLKSKNDTAIVAALKDQIKKLTF